MNRPRLIKINSQLVLVCPDAPGIVNREEYEYLSNNLLLLRDPSLRAFAQDDSQSFGVRGEKKGGFAAFLFSSPVLAKNCHPERSEGTHLRINIRYSE